MKFRGFAKVCWTIGLIVGVVIWQARADNGALKMTLTVKETQDGFAGTTGTVWTIEPDWRFRVSRIFNQHAAEPHLKGTLTPVQQKRLSEVLNKEAPAELQAQIGVASVNAHCFTLEFNGKVSVLSVGANDLEMGAIRTSNPHDPARRLLEVAEAVKDMLGS